MTCPAHLFDGPLACTVSGAHVTHVYMASDAPDLPREEEAL